MKQKNLWKPGLLCLMLGLTLLSCTHSDHAKVPAAAAMAPVGITDNEIRDVVNRVARHQLHPLKDGDYPPVKEAAALTSVQAAAKPDGIAWSYPWGVALYGLIRSTDVTRDKEVENFVLEHNHICSRDYSWLTALRAGVGDAPEVTELFDKSRIRGLLRLGNLDSCGAMGAQMVEGILRHPDQESPEEKAVVARIADWIANKQDRLPDGTLWRSKAMNGTVWPDDLYMSAPFLIRYAKYTGDQKYLDDAANQIIHQAALEQDTTAFGFMDILSAKRNMLLISGGGAMDGSQSPPWKCFRPWRKIIRHVPNSSRSCASRWKG